MSNFVCYTKGLTVKFIFERLCARRKNNNPKKQTFSKPHIEIYFFPTSAVAITGQQDRINLFLRVSLYSRASQNTG